MKITSPSQLRTLYGNPADRAQNKVMTELDTHAITFLENSPFVVISTCDTSGHMDTSPRGGLPGFVKVMDSNTIAIPDSKGNNRVDSLINIIETGQIGSLFFLPGMDETLRINGTAHISLNPDHLQLFSSENHPPKTCVILHVQEVFLHCAKALMRSKLWSAEAQIHRSTFPTMGQMLKDQLGSKEAPESQEEMVKRYTPDL